LCTWHSAPPAPPRHHYRHHHRQQQDLADEAGSKPLQPTQLAQALAVAQALADVLGHSAGSTSKEAAAGGSGSGTVLVPDASGVMRPAADLAFDDAPWMDNAGTDEQLQLVHPRISAPVADALGVASRRRLMLASASASYLSLGLVGAGGGIEAFGQSEALTTRLRHIINDYPEGPVGWESEIVGCE
jgi:sacsin